ncbi:hypothetical protein AMECASPLE_008988 [Ameca splendens]|uniref:Uncharacterized protein n=1 Tax=Ameca splendens TaxID=208324 RepID=A0ABV0XP10_9TELE
MVERIAKLRAFDALPCNEITGLQEWWKQRESGKKKSLKEYMKVQLFLKIPTVMASVRTDHLRVKLLLS